MTTQAQAAGPQLRGARRLPAAPSGPSLPQIQAWDDYWRYRKHLERMKEAGWPVQSWHRIECARRRARYELLCARHETEAKEA